jgi:hypothetical protein
MSTQIWIAMVIMLTFYLRERIRKRQRKLMKRQCQKLQISSKILC